MYSSDVVAHRRETFSLLNRRLSDPYYDITDSKVAAIVGSVGQAGRKSFNLKCLGFQGFNIDKLAEYMPGGARNLITFGWPPQFSQPKSCHSSDEVGAILF
jgi:hypothetical protein